MNEEKPNVEDLKRFATEREELTNRPYEPPRGIPILEVPPAAKLYTYEEPSEQKDKLISYERRHIIPIAMMVAPVFDVMPIPDDVWKATPDYHKNHLFCILSRSNIQKVNDSALNWDAIVITIQRMCVVRINCELRPRDDVFSIKKLYLWNRKTQNYAVVEDTAAGKVDPAVLPYILERYVQIEGILGKD